MKPTRVLERFDFVFPDFLAEWDVWPYWEHERFEEMERQLQQGDVLYDVGAESGALSALYSTIVGADHMVLIEPSVEHWPLIKAIWEVNGLRQPLVCAAVLAGEDWSFPRDIGIFDAITRNGGWPAVADGELITEGRPYRYLHNPKHVALTPTVPLDELCALTIPPDAITIDVEGAELRVLRGAERIFDLYHPKVFVSIHPDLMERDYGDDPNQLKWWMEVAQGYQGRHLATDHEEHWLFL